MRILSLCVIFLAFSCKPSSDNMNLSASTSERAPEATSLLGEPLFANVPTAVQLELQTKNLEEAQKNYNLDSTNEMNIVWLGRRLAYMMSYNDAIEVYDKGIEVHPGSYKLYRHRAHRYLSIRKFDLAIADFEKAAKLAEGTEQQLEPDAIPNSLNQPLSSTQWNIYYHLGLTYYLNGEFESAERAYRICYEMSQNDDVLVAISDWLYMCLMRQDKPGEAAEILALLPKEPVIIENDSYRNRLDLYAGERTAEELLNLDPEDENYDMTIATQGYGVGDWYLYNGDSSKAKEIFEQVVAGKHWSSFGYIAAEAELARWE